jgi:F-type H+-transporting ATPase subunit b
MIIGLVPATIGLLAAAAGAGGEAHAKGLPQLDATTYAPQLIWLAITFVALLLLMSSVVIPRIRSVIEDRRERIEKDLAEAERLKGETDKALKAYEQALAEARGKAHGIAQETRDALKAETERERAKVDREVAARMSEAEARIQAAKASALAQVSGIAAETAQAVVKQLLGLDIPRTEAEAAVQARTRS